ncbi:MAG TPA: choline-sulfatase [Phycisphaerales bacterium]|nr:choline-sulfatase [Phycisphaerales bacterium]
MREEIRWGLLIVLLLTGLPLSGQAQSAKPAPPNILFIAVDDLNDWVGPLGGHPQAKTPAMDRLARRGTVFTNAHTQAPLCNPSRASLLSGRRPSSTGLYTLQPGVRAVPALRDHVMLPQYLAGRGYRTFSTGKIYHDGSIKPAERAREFEAWGTNGPMPYPPQKFVATPDPIKAMDWGIFPENDEQQADWQIADAAIQYLKSAPADRPFFLAAGFRLPHVPCFASRKWFDLYPDETLAMPPVKADDRDDVPDFAWYLHWKLPEPRLSWLQASAQWRPLVRAYLASISFMDSQIGRLLDALDASGHANRTIVVLWSDHGWHLGEKGISGKNTLWDRSTRVPLIFAGPRSFAAINANQKCTQPAELLDIYPTLIDLCGLPPREGLEGRSLVPQLKDAKASREQPAITTHNQGNHAIRTETWRYIRYADGSEELYDMAADPTEWTNLAADPKHAERKKELARWLPKTDVPAAPGSAHRVLQNKDGIWHWEGKPIRQQEKEE